jgi:structure-specific recognition protein 1
VAASGMGWKGVDSEGRTLLSSDNIKWAQWLRVARNYQLRVGMKDRKRFTFDGFLREVGTSSPTVTVPTY